MPGLRKNNVVVAILCSDLHLQETPPPARAGEPDWFAAMRRPLDELRELQFKHACPIICAGDIFDRHDPRPALVNFAIKALPKMYAVPGQHDLPLHNAADIYKSAFWTLCEAGRIVPLGVPELTATKMLFQNRRDRLQQKFFISMTGFGWGAPLDKAHVIKKDDRLRIAVVHKFCWAGRKPFPGVSKENHVSYFQKKLKGFDVIAVGDNHRGFQEYNIFNCGAFMRRRSDEEKYRPRVGLVSISGHVTPHYLNTSQDVFQSVAAETSETAIADFADFVEELKALGDAALDFRAAIHRWCERRQVSKSVKKILLGIADQE